MAKLTDNTVMKYYVPQYGVTVEANSLEAAIEKAKREGDKKTLEPSAPTEPVIEPGTNKPVKKDQ